jgi:hypothetical protein
VADATWGSAEQTLPHVPQFSGSVFVSTQLVPQTVFEQVAASEAASFDPSTPVSPWEALSAPPDESPVDGPSSDGPMEVSSPVPSAIEPSVVLPTSGWVVKSPMTDEHPANTETTTRATKVRSPESAKRMKRDYRHAAREGARLSKPSDRNRFRKKRHQPPC